MSYTTGHKQKFDDLKLKLENKDLIRQQANGGNSILFSYQPTEELLYIKKARELYHKKARFIDVSKLLVKFIDEEGWDSFQDYYYEFQTNPNKIFHSVEDPAIDLFDMIISEIVQACNNDKIPFLVRTGSLFGTDIENVNIMENKTVMNLRHPLVIFYPSKIMDDNLYFLNFKPASKYRCILIK